MTLTEVLVAVALLGIIFVPLANALIFGLRKTNDETRNRLIESHDAQLVSVHLPGDLKSAKTAVASPTAPPGACGTTTGHVLTLAWKEPADQDKPPDEFSASYYLQDTGTGRNKLIRKLCENGTIDESFAVAHHLCPPSASCTPAAVVSPPNSSTSETTLRLVAVTGYTYDISGSGRVR